MNSKILIFSLIIHRFTSSTQTFAGLKIEPFSIILGKPTEVSESSNWSISIYIIFGKNKFKLLYNPPNNLDPVCGTIECVRGFGICIQIGKNTNQTLKDFKDRNSTNLGDLNLEDQTRLLEAFRDIIDEGNSLHANFIASTQAYRETPSPPGTEVVLAQFLLNGQTSTNWSIFIEETLLFRYLVDGDFEMLLGEPKAPNKSIYALQTNQSHIKNIVPFTNCEFNRKLVRISMCSKTLYNAEMCLYYSMLVLLNPACGEDIRPTTFTLRIVSPIVLFIRLVKKLIDILINNP